MYLNIYVKCITMYIHICLSTYLCTYVPMYLCIFLYIYKSIICFFYTCGYSVLNSPTRYTALLCFVKLDNCSGKYSQKIQNKRL